MSKKSGTFVDLCLAGQARPEDLEAFEEQWHTGDSAESLASYLGFTDDEYALIVEQPTLLDYVLISRKLKITLESALEFTRTFALSVGARLPENGSELKDWLSSRKRA